ncbi:MAG: AI-2E family transporter [Acidiferrobacterales bacterium]
MVPFLISLAAFVVIVAGMRAAQPLLIPFLLAAFIAVISAPPLFWLQRKGVPTILALLIVLLVVIAIGFVMGTLVGTSLKDFSQSLPTYDARLREQATSILAWLSGLGVKVSEQELLNAFDPAAAMNLVASMLNGLRGVLTNSFLILLTVIFILLEASSFPAKLRAVSDSVNASLGGFDKFTENIKRYMAIKTVVSLATGIAIAIWLAIIGVDHPLLWGLLAFLFNYIPNVGSILAAVPAVLLALIQLGVGAALWSGLGYLVVNIVVGQVIEPRFMGRGLGLSTLVVFVSLVFWGWVLGPVGMFLSVPLTMTVKIALESSDETRWIAILLGPAVPSSQATSVAQESIGEEANAETSTPTDKTP